ncbi:hypothetical protein [uncultured Corynebacterium sp.]|uniref:hypothetical protein n=1 Tax=uncultured Corynebacterium sp. TaxID=159447 RepID=UPI0025E4E95B|nr:hypothetical protein [uncultured Corynebacterium sp.]
MDDALNGSVDAFGQWLTQLPVVGQTIVLLAILVPLGGVIAFGFIGLIDIVVGRVSGRWAKRPTRGDGARIELVEHDRP